MVAPLPVSRETSDSFRLYSFANAEFREDDIQQIFHIHAAGDLTEAVRSEAQIFRLYLKRQIRSNKLDIRDGFA